MPTWILSYGDMVTQLLAFFVLLQSFAHVRDASLFFVGQGSYRRAIAGLGLPAWLFGREDKPVRGHPSTKYPTEETTDANVPRQDTRDADDEKIRNLFADLRKQMEVAAEDAAAKLVRVEATPIRFAPGSERLDEPARGHLRQFVADLREALAGKAVRVCVVGLAAEEKAPQRQWMLSAGRARAVEAHLTELLATAGAAGQWQVCSWGAGPGGAWCRRHGVLPQRTSIVMVVLTEDNSNG